MKPIIIFFLVFLKVNCWKCPHCFCYKWRDMLKTNCARRNLYNTFINIPHETQVLDLSYNVISILHGNEFLDANLQELRYLILFYNNLYRVDRLSFNGLRYLEYVDLSHNKIEFLDSTTFNDNTNLKWLNLSYNPLNYEKNEPIISFAPSLQLLNIAGCKLKNVALDLFKNLENLQILNISDNEIQKINLEVLKPLKKLKILDVSKNDLICNDEIASLIQWLRNQHIKVSSFCQLSERMIIAEDSMSDDTAEVLDLNIFDDVNVTRNNSTEIHQSFGNFLKFFQVLPPYYVVLCGIQIGIIVGSCVTYLCLRKSKQNISYVSSQRGFVNNNPDNSTFALIPLRTPPGTPPSPYHSRLILPSTNSLSR